MKCVACPFAVASIIFCTGLIGCGGETNKDLLARFGDRLNQRRENLSRLAALLPPPGTFTENERCKPFDPPLAARTGSVGLLTPGNCDWMMVEELDQPLIYHFDAPPFEMYFQSALLDALALADPQSRHYCGDSHENSDANAEVFKAAAEVRYAVVLRTIEYVKPAVMAGEDADAPLRYSDGRIVFEALVCELESPRVLCGFQASASPSFGKSLINVEKGKSAALRLEKELHYKLVDEARKRIVAALSEVAGAN